LTKVEKLISFYNQRLTLIKDESVGEIDTTTVHEDLTKCKRMPKILIIGEAPGETEVIKKKPFVGPAGKNLEILLKLGNLVRGVDVIVTNAFPFRTMKDGDIGKKNRTPKSSEIKANIKILEKEIEIIEPKAIICLGGSAKKAFTYIQKGKYMNFTEYKYGDSKLWFVFHPSPIAFNRKEIRLELINFFKKFKN